MSKKHTQIGQQLHQGGMPASHAQAIAKWLGSLLAKPEREYGPDSPQANDPEWLNDFLPPESPPNPNAGDNAWLDGIGGNTDGLDEFDPSYPIAPIQPPWAEGGGSTIIDNTTGFNPTDLTPLISRITRLEEQMADVLYRLGMLEATVRNLRNEVDALTRKVMGHDKRLDDIERRLDACCGGGGGGGVAVKCDAAGKSGVGNDFFTLATDAAAGIIRLAVNCPNAVTVDVKVVEGGNETWYRGKTNGSTIDHCHPAGVPNVRIEVETAAGNQWTVAAACPEIPCPNNPFTEENPLP